MKKKFIILFILVALFLFPVIKKNSINIKQEKYTEGTNQKASDYLISKANNENITDYYSSDIGEMYTFNHEATEQTGALTDYRYIGNNPNNYIYFNCTDENDTSTCEVWRIIGVFPVENENGKKEFRIKIIRDSLDYYFYWTTVKMEDNYEAILQDDVHYSLAAENETDDWLETSINESFNNGTYWNSLSDTSKNMIGQTKYYLGAMEFQEYLSNLKLSGNDFYNIERNNTNFTNVSNWIGKIALMYPSDYVYTFANDVNEKCYTDVFNCGEGRPSSSWIYNSLDYKSNDNKNPSKTLNHMIAPYVAVFSINRSSNSGSIDIPAGTGYFRPVAYLKSDIYVESGTGNINSPYKLSLEPKKEDNSTNTEIENSNSYTYKEYKTGDIVNYDGEEYYVIKNSDSKTSYITLLKANVLSNKEVLKYTGGDYHSLIPYYMWCGSSSSDSCGSNMYNDSYAKILIDNWSKKFGDDLVTIDGYKARLITLNELVESLGVNQNSESVYTISDDNLYKEWLYNNEYSYWTMTPSSKNNFIVCVSSFGFLYDSKNSSSNSIRPVINLNKCAIEDCPIGSNNELVCKNGFETKKVAHYNSFKIGDEVEYKGEKYHVIEKSRKDSNYVTLLKDVPLLVDELYKYGRDENDNLFVNKNIINSDDPEMVVFRYSDNVGGMSYYNSETCRSTFYWSISNFYSSENVFNGCKNDYKISDVKRVLDNWEKDKFKDDELVEVNNYKTRLITMDELLSNLGVIYVDANTNLSYYKFDDSYEWLSKYKYWTMTPIDDSKKELFIIYDEYISKETVTDLSTSVRPVININKCALEDGCWYEDVVIGCKDEDANVTNETIVNVENTLKILSKVMLVISILLVISGLSFFVISYIKSKRDKKNIIR